MSRTKRPSLYVRSLLRLITNLTPAVLTLLLLDHVTYLSDGNYYSDAILWSLEHRSLYWRVEDLQQQQCCSRKEVKAPERTPVLLCHHA